MRKHMPNSKNSALSNLEENLFSMSEEESSLLSEAIMTQKNADCQLNEVSLNTSEATTGDGAISRSMIMAALPLR